MLMSKIAVASVGATALAVTAHAQMTTYTYVGAPMTGAITYGIPEGSLETTALSGTIVLAAPLKPNEANQIVTPVKYQFGNNSYLSDTFWTNPEVKNCLALSQQSQIPDDDCSTRFFMFSTVGGQITSWAIFINSLPSGLVANFNVSMSSVSQPSFAEDAYSGFSGPNSCAPGPARCTRWSASGPAGTWVEGVANIPSAPPAPTTLNALGCEPGSKVFKVVPLSNSTSVALRAGATGGPSACAVPLSKPSTWYIQLTIDGGVSWYWEPLGNFNLGAGFAE